MFSIIVAIGEEREIGLEGDMIWYIASDLKRFKQVTMGNPIIMGRKTFESLPKKPLPGRPHYVLTRDKHFHFDGVQVCHDVDELISHDFSDKEPFVIGGAEVYSLFLPFANKLYLTRIHASSDDADVYFPEIDLSKWELKEEVYFAAEGDTPAYTYSVLEKNDFE